MNRGVDDDTNTYTCESSKIDLSCTLKLYFLLFQKQAYYYLMTRYSLITAMYSYKLD